MPTTRSARKSRKGVSSTAPVVVQRPGQTLRLSDAEAAPAVLRALKQVTTSPEAARSFLQAGGFLTASGRLPRKYGG